MRGFRMNLGRLSLLLWATSASCGQLWGYYTTPDPDNCLRDLTVCKSGFHCNLKTQACDPDAPPFVPVDLFPPPTAPQSYISPGGTATALSFPRDVQYVVAAPIPATMYYTLDGTTPAAGQGTTMSGPSPLSLGALPGGTVLKYYADYGSSSGYTAESPHTFTATTDASPPADYGVISENVFFSSSKGPVAVVRRGELVGLRLAFQAWTSTAAGMCPSCKLQYVVAVTGLGQVNCVEAIEASGSYPGKSYITAMYFYAPMTTGRFPVIAGLTTKPACDITAIPTGTEIGELWVD